MKTCTKCGEEKELTEFRQTMSKKNNNLMSYCKLCECAQMKEWRERNPERVKSLGKKQKAKPEYKEKARVWAKSYRDNNKERIRDYAKKWRADSRGNINEVQIKWRKDNPEVVRTLAANQYKRDRPKTLANLRKEVEELSDKYIKGSLTKGNTLSFADIPPELIALKRVQLQILREARK